MDEETANQALRAVMKFEQCVAKTSGDRPGMKVDQHCKIVGSVAQELIARLPCTVAARMPQGSATIAAIHDAGKVSPGFQKKVANEYVRDVAPDLAGQPNSNFETDHCKVGAAALRRFLNVGCRQCPPAEIVAAHHGGVEGPPSRTDTRPAYGGHEWAEERRRLIDVLISEFGDIGEMSSDPAVQAAVAGLVTVADWIGSDEDFFPPEGLPAEVDLRARAVKDLNDCGWAVPKVIPCLHFDDIFGFPPYRLQQAFIDLVTCPGLYILEAPMGSGKTEAALFAAYKLMSSIASRGFYFGLPTRLTSDKIHERVTPFLKRICDTDTPPKLAHGAAWLKAFDHGGEARSYDREHEGLAPGCTWFNPRKRALLYPFGVGTIDQALLGVLRVKHYFVRMFGLAGKVVILDEVHSYDIYTGTLLESLVRQLLSLGCTVIVLSATLTGKRRGSLLSGNGVSTTDDDYPMITAERGGRVKSVPIAPPPGHEYVVRVHDWNDGAVAEAAAAKAAAGNCVLCIANTVAQAQQWYDAISATMTQDQFPLGLLHSKFPGFRREQIENEWLKKLDKNGDDRPNGCVLVATQVVEQSVDIDADFLITQLAPTDMLLQRMGRVWRHLRDDRPIGQPEIVIVSGDPSGAETKDELVEALGRKSCFVYQPYVLWRSWIVWVSRAHVALPGDIRDLIQQTYAPPSEAESAAVREIRQILDDWQDRLRKLAKAAKAGVKGLGVMTDDERAATRYSDLPMVEVLLVHSVQTDGRTAKIELLEDGLIVNVHADRKDFIVTARLHRQLVAVPLYALKKLGELKRPLWLRKHFYDATPVWEWDEATGALHWNGAPTGFAYDPTRGLRRLTDVSPGAPRPYDDYEEMDVFDKTRFDW